MFSENSQKIQGVVGHVSLEISRYLFFAIKHGCKVDGEVMDTKHYRSPLTQGGLEIKCRVTLTWTDALKFDFLKTFIEKNYSFENREKDDSREILEQINAAIGQVHIESEDE